MMFHTDHVTYSNIYDAARAAGVSLDVCEEKGSRSRERAYKIVLSGDSPSRQNTNGSDRERNFAASWDQWGVFLAHLFHIDRDAHTGKHGYKSGNHFDYVTSDRFGSGQMPEDYHRRHTWDWNGSVSECRSPHCSAEWRRNGWHTE